MVMHRKLFVDPSVLTLQKNQECEQNLHPTKQINLHGEIANQKEMVKEVYINYYESASNLFLIDLMNKLFLIWWIFTLFNFILDKTINLKNKRNQLKNR